jgi:hypothetical protein
VADMNQKVVDINNEDITTVMTILGVPYDTAKELIRDGLNMQYLRTGLKDDIERDTTQLRDEYVNRINEMIKTEFES